jgi:putative membrane protein
VLVIYLTASIIGKLKLSKPLTVLIASILTVGYDLVLEQLAPKMMMWTWKGDTIPFKNYVAWFVLSLIFHSLVQYSNIKTKNKLAFVIFATQLMFFVLLLFK